MGWRRKNRSQKKERKRNDKKEKKKRAKSGKVASFFKKLIPCCPPGATVAPIIDEWMEDAPSHVAPNNKQRASGRLQKGPAGKFSQESGKSGKNAPRGNGKGRQNGHSASTRNEGKANGSGSPTRRGRPSRAAVHPVSEDLSGDSGTTQAAPLKGSSRGRKARRMGERVPRPNEERSKGDSSLNRQNNPPPPNISGVPEEQANTPATLGPDVPTKNGSRKNRKAVPRLVEVKPRKDADNTFRGFQNKTGRKSDILPAVPLTSGIFKHLKAFKKSKKSFDTGRDMATNKESRTGPTFGNRDVSKMSAIPSKSGHKATKLPYPQWVSRSEGHFRTTVHHAKHLPSYAPVRTGPQESVITTHRDRQRLDESSTRVFGVHQDNATRQGMHVSSPPLPFHKTSSRRSFGISSRQEIREGRTTSASQHKSGTASLATETVDATHTYYGTARDSLKSPTSGAEAPCYEVASGSPTRSGRAAGSLSPYNRVRGSEPVMYESPAPYPFQRDIFESEGSSESETALHADRYLSPKPRDSAQDQSEKKAAVASLAQLYYEIKASIEEEDMLAERHDQMENGSPVAYNVLSREDYPPMPNVYRPLPTEYHSPSNLHISHDETIQDDDRSGFGQKAHSSTQMYIPSWAPPSQDVSSPVHYNRLDTSPVFRYTPSWMNGPSGITSPDKPGRVAVTSGHLLPASRCISSPADILPEVPTKHVNLPSSRFSYVPSWADGKRLQTSSHVKTDATIVSLGSDLSLHTEEAISRDASRAPSRLGDERDDLIFDLPTTVRPGTAIASRMTSRQPVASKDEEDFTLYYKGVPFSSRQTHKDKSSRVVLKSAAKNAVYSRYGQHIQRQSTPVINDLNDYTPRLTELEDLKALPDMPSLSYDRLLSNQASSTDQHIPFVPEEDDGVTNGDEPYDEIEETLTPNEDAYDNHYLPLILTSAVGLRGWCLPLSINQFEVQPYSPYKLDRNIPIMSCAINHLMIAIFYYSNHFEDGMQFRGEVCKKHVHDTILQAIKKGNTIHLEHLPHSQQISAIHAFRIVSKYGLTGTLDWDKDSILAQCREIGVDFSEDELPSGLAMEIVNPSSPDSALCAHAAALDPSEYEALLYTFAGQFMVLLPTTDGRVLLIDVHMHRSLKAGAVVLVAPQTSQDIQLMLDKYYAEHHSSIRYNLGQGTKFTYRMPLSA